MGSANGRHRRPRQAPAIVVAAGVTGSAIAIPLLGASGASAAEATTWDRVAECESGGAWSADFGNGSYGGLQISPEVWKAYGGETYADRADLASRAQQIAVAEKVLADKGPQAWPSCAVISGLATDGSLPGVDPGTTPSGDEQDDTSDVVTPPHSAWEGADAVDGSDGSSGNSGKHKGGSNGNGKGSKAPSAETSPSATPSDSTGAPSKAGQDDSASPESSSGTNGRHRGAPAADESRGADGGHRESGRHASRGGDARDTAGQAADGTYAVRSGDNLWTIADAQKVPGGWPALYEANKDVIGSDPDLILPGQSLDLGVKAE
ncbi:transglycosylase family protein [Streptomyces sp. NPDC092952]|uniref:transglycosylase family protein n=1 Tax=Streptomyces sp. NPDC092952 TaxID=3366018 RepID=UPI00380C1FAD